MVWADGDISHESQTCKFLSLRDNRDEVVCPGNGCGQIGRGCGQRESRSQIVRPDEYKETATYIAVPKHDS